MVTRSVFGVEIGEVEAFAALEEEEAFGALEAAFDGRDVVVVLEADLLGELTLLIELRLVTSS